ncbi:hypothetical protein ACIOHE_24225 [Streptomyces sp. NPDC087851]|uniref:hypothetical protein n=1 Tax=Streptomyces sp. NPDC087851 TaxID=3365810 RepID=UPI003820528D
MTAVLPETTLMEQQAAMLRRINVILSDSPFGTSFRLLVTPSEMTNGDDEVLIQEFNEERGIIEIRPRSITNLHPTDIIHETQVVDPGDQDFIDYANTPMAGNCKTHTFPDGGTVHNYIM